MSAKQCARPECGKSVYPMEELKCLDQVWHKQCFRCSVCSMVLNMKNYKGYNKMPYCEAHYPKMQATVVGDTPELRRLQEATKNQSLVKYHEEFEKMKGKKTDVADDPELQRHKKNTAIQSNVSYHGEVERKETMEKIRPPLEEVVPPVNKAQHPPVSNNQPPPMMGQKMPTTASPAPVSPPGGREPPVKNSPYSSKQQQQSTLIYSSEMGGRVAPQSRQVGRIDDYDPLNGQWGSASSGRAPNPAASYSHHPPPQQQQQQQPKRSPTSPTTDGGPGSQMARRSGGAPKSGGARYRAMYDYSATDTDEVTFKEGDIIVNCQSVDQGWMTGTVERTGQWGMLPANYVEKVH